MASRSGGLFGKPEALLVDEDAPRISMPLPPPVAAQPVDDWDEDEEDDDSVDTADSSPGAPLRLFLGNPGGDRDVLDPDVFDLSAALGEEPPAARAPQLHALEDATEDDPPVPARRRVEVFTPQARPRAADPSPPRRDALYGRPSGATPADPAPAEETPFASDGGYGDSPFGDLEGFDDASFRRALASRDAFPPPPAEDPDRTEDMEAEGPSAADLFGRPRNPSSLPPGTLVPDELNELGSAFGFRAPSKQELEDILRDPAVPGEPEPAASTEPELHSPRSIFKAGARMRSLDPDFDRDELPLEPWDNYGRPEPTSAEHVRTSRMSQPPPERPSAPRPEVPPLRLDFASDPAASAPPPAPSPSRPAPSREPPNLRKSLAATRELPPEQKHYVPLKAKHGRDHRLTIVLAVGLVVLVAVGFVAVRARKAHVAPVPEAKAPEVTAIDATSAVPASPAPSAEPAPAPAEATPAEAAPAEAAAPEEELPPIDPPGKPAVPAQVERPAEPAVPAAVPESQPLAAPVAPATPEEKRKAKMYQSPLNQTGLLRITCDGKATIYIDGKRHGTCDTLLPLEMSAGMHKVKATLGGKTRTIDARVDPGTMREVQFRFD